MPTDSSFRIPDIRRWMFDQALPLWIEAGQDEPGLGFRELLNLDGQPLDAGFKRMRVQARQIYTFCHAALMGWRPDESLAAARNGMEFVIANGWLSKGGWARRLGNAGEQIDENLDAYEQAFMLFAFAWYYKATGDRRMVNHAHRTIDNMYRRLAHPAQGFLTEAPNCAELQQNPHMHYLEAMLVWYSATGEQRFADEARMVLKLFAGKLFQKDSGVLPEFFAMDWQPAPGARGEIVEPGHHFEWTWLLNEAIRVLKLENAEADAIRACAAALYGRMALPGGEGLPSCDDSFLVYDAITRTGEILRADHRAWPQTEALKAAIAVAEAGNTAAVGFAAKAIDNLLNLYLATDVPGLWIDHFNRHRQPLSQTVPASTLYHVFLAFAETLRHAEKSGMA